MFGSTKRVNSIIINTTEETRYTWDESLDLGIMGLRISKTKEGVYIYHNQQYSFIPWNRIKDMKIYL